MAKDSPIKLSQRPLVVFLTSLAALAWFGGGCSRKSGRAPIDAVPSGTETASAAAPDPIDYPTISAILTKISQERDEAKGEALRGRLRKLIPDCVPIVLTIAADKSHPAGLSAMYFLASQNLGPHEDAVQTFVAGALGDPDGARRAAALCVLYEQQWPEATAQRLLQAWNDDLDPKVRAQLVASAATLDPFSPQLWRLVVGALAEGDADVRDAGCTALEDLQGKLQPYRKELPPLYQASKTDRARDAILTAMACCTLDETAAGFLEKILAGPACGEQLLALKACLALPSNTPGLLDAAMPAFKQTEYGDVQEAAVAVIAYQRPVTAAQVDLLVRTARDDKDQITRWAAVKGLAEMGPQARDGLSELVKMVHAAGPISAIRMYYAGAVYEITRKRPRGMIRRFNNPPNGYPW